MGVYLCRDCQGKLSDTHDKDCIHCGAIEPWVTHEHRERIKMYDYWLAEENKHTKAYTDYLNRFAGSIRFRKEIDYHVKKANEAQEEKKKWFGDGKL